MHRKTNTPIPRSLQHPPAPFAQEPDTPYVLGAGAVAIGLLWAGLLFHPAPSQGGIGPEPGAVAAGETNAVASETVPPVVAAAATGPVEDSNTIVSGALQVGTAASQASSATGSGGGTGPLAIAATQTKPTVQPRTKTGIRPVDSLIDRTAHRVRYRAKRK